MYAESAYADSVANHVVGNLVLSSLNWLRVHSQNGIPDGEAGITKEWLTSCLLGRKLIAANNSVASMELTQIGVGRGYANYTFKAFVKYARPVCPDTPSAFAIKVANTTFGEIMLADQGPDLWEWFNDFYICEAFLCVRMCHTQAQAHARCQHTHPVHFFTKQCR